MRSETIIARLGGTVAVAKLCECSPQAVSQWFGLDAEGKERDIPHARKLYLKAIRPDVFVEEAPRKKKAGAQHG